MGRKSLAQIEQEKKQAELANNTGSGVDQTAGEPSANTPAGETQKAADAEGNNVAKAADAIIEESEQQNQADAAKATVSNTLIDVNQIQENDKSNTGPDGIKRNEDGTIDWPASGVELLENGNIKVKGVEFGPEIAEKILTDGTVVDGIITMHPDQWNALVEEHEIKDNEPETVEQSDLDGFPFLVKAGIKVGDLRSESVTKYLSFMDLIGADQNDDQDAINTKIEAYEASLNNSNNGKNVYHGDFLTRAQAAAEVNITYDWDEVTAPEHLVYKPQ